MKNRMLLIPLALILVLSLAVACAAPAPTPTPAPTPAPAPAPTKTEFRVLSMRPPGHVQFPPLQRLMDTITERSNGDITFNYLGSGEVVGLYDQPEALMSGVCDFLYIFGEAYNKLLPMTIAIAQSTQTWTKMRETELWDYIQVRHKEHNMRILGGVNASVDGHFLFTRDEIKSPKEIAKLKFVTGTGQAPPVIALGGDAVILPGSEKYGAVEKGIVDGVGGLLTSHVSDSLYEVTSYWIDYKFATARDWWIINLEVWDGLPPEQQKLMTEVAKESEIWTEMEYRRDVFAAAREKAIEEGMRPIYFNKEDATWYETTARGGLWSEYEKRVSPEEYDMMRKLILK